MASSLLSYPLTLLYCLGVPVPAAAANAVGGGVTTPSSSVKGPAAKPPPQPTPPCSRALGEALRRRQQPGGGPLVVCVLGASGDAELAHPALAWKVSQAGLQGDGSPHFSTHFPRSYLLSACHSLNQRRHQTCHSGCLGSVAIYRS